MINIAFFTSDISKSGGTQRVVTLLANELVGIGYGVYIFSLDLNHRDSFYQLEESVSVISIDYKYKISHFLKISSNINELIQRFSIKTILGIGCYYSLLLPLFRVKKRIACEHSSFFMPSFRIRMLRSISYKFCDYVVALTYADYEELKKINSKTVLIPNPLPFFGTLTEKKENTIVSIGSLVIGKGYDRMLSVWQLIELKNLDYKLNIYGDGPEKEHLQQICDKLKLQNVNFCGTTTDVKSVLEKAKVLIHTSYSEGFGMVLIEALACDTPVVSFDVKVGPKEIISNYINGFLIPDGNLQEFAEKVLLLLDDNEMYDEIQSNCRKSVERFSIENVMKKWEEIL